MSEIISSLYPTPGDSDVPVVSAVTLDVAGDSAIDLTQVEGSIRFGAPSDPDYPVSPDYYGSTIDKNFLQSLAAAPDADGFHPFVVWNGSEFEYGAEAQDNSSVLVSPDQKKIRFRVVFNQQLDYNTEYAIRIVTANTLQLLTFRTERRPFYSPAIGDPQSDFEFFVENNDWSAKLPETWKLREYAIDKFDPRARILAVRRIVSLALERNLGFNDLPTVARQIQLEFRNITFDQVAVPSGLKEIDLRLAGYVVPLMQRALAELRTNRSIPEQWVGPLVSAADFNRISLNYRVRLAAQIIAVASRAVKDGLI